MVVGDFPAQADLFDKLVLGAQLEDFVAKRLASPYLPGVLTRDWLNRLVEIRNTYSGGA